jgi:alpha-1,4-digalacturonate transport system permease protein
MTKRTSKTWDTLQTPLMRLWALLVGWLDVVLIPLQRRIGIQRMAYFFVLPNLLIFGVFILLPMFLNFGYAVTGSTEFFLDERPYVGTENFRTLLTCEDYSNPITCEQDIFWRALGNTVVFVVVNVSVIVVLSVVTALALNHPIRGKVFFRSVVFYPVLLSPVVVALIWRWILQRDGLLNAIIVGLGGERVPFLLNPEWARFWVIFVSVWAQLGFYTLILLAGLQSIPHEYYEAAKIDGANNTRLFRHITLPLLSPTLLVVTVLCLIRAVQIFDQAYSLNGGGPGTATTYIVQYIYNTGFTGTSRLAGLAAAASVMLAGVLLVFTVIQLRVGRRTEI